MTVKKLVIDEDNSGRRIDNYLLSFLSSLPRSKIYNIIRKGEVRVNSSRIKPSYKLMEGDLIRIPPNLELTKFSQKKIDKNLIVKHTENILFENSNYIITNKQNNISVHSGTKNYIGLIDIFRKKYGDEIDLCHRLDKTTTGCLVFAKNKKAIKNFTYCLSNKKVEKTYSAIIKGIFKGERVVEKAIYKNDKSKSKLAISKFSCIETHKNTSLVDVKIFTGRTHQIRIHASQINHPILFDMKYGDSKFDTSLNIGKFNIALHSKEISFPDLDSKNIKVSCNYPNDFHNIIEKLR